MKTQIEMMRALSSQTRDEARRAIEEAKERARALGAATATATVVATADDARRTNGEPETSLGSSRDDEGFAVARARAVDVTKDVPGAPRNLRERETADAQKATGASWGVELYDMDIKYEGLVIGPGGATIRKLQQDIGTTIEVVRGEGKLQIKGSREKIAHAREKLDEFFRLKGSKTLTVDCKARSGLLIGNAGQTIKALKEQTGCRIEVMRDVEKCVITGPGDRVEFAKSLIEKMIADSWEAGADGDVNIIEEVVPCAYKSGAIIGPGGNTIRNIRESTGVAIDIERGADGCKAGDRCRIVGTATQVKKAVEIVRQLLREMDQQQLAAATPATPPMFAAYAQHAQYLDPTHAYYAQYYAAMMHAQHAAASGHLPPHSGDPPPPPP